MLLDKYNFDGVKAHARGVSPLVVTKENARKAIFKKMGRVGGIGSTGRASRRMTQRGWMLRGNSFAGQRHGQRVVVKIRYVKHKSGTSGAGGVSALKGHLKYISRSGAGADGEKAVLFDQSCEGVSQKDFFTLCEGDRHHFRFIISPENGHEIEDFHFYVRSVMGTVEKDLGTKLEWVSAVHYDTDDPHAHVVVRGRTDRDADLVIGQDYIKEGVRRRAQEVATTLLGERSLGDIQKSLESEVTAASVTSLDRFLEKQASENPERKVDVRRRVNFGQSLFYEGLIKGRLQYLGQGGLAQENLPGVYTLADDYQSVLRQIADRSEVMKRLGRGVGSGFESIALYSLKAGKGEKIEGSVVAKGVDDELYDRKFLVVKGSKGLLHYVRIGDSKHYDGLVVGSLVSVHPGEASTGKADYNILKMAELNEGVYDPTKHLEYIKKNRADIRDDDQSKYISSHIIRLHTLEKNGVVKALGVNCFKIPVDLIERGEIVTRHINEREQKRFYPVLSILSVDPPEKMISTLKKTWLDKELYKQSVGREASEVAHDLVVGAALEKRKDWLIKHDLGFIQSNGGFAFRVHAFGQLDKMEVNSAGQKLAGKLGFLFNEKQVRADTVMRFEGFVTLETGVWAAVSKEKILHLVPLRSEPKFERGTPVVLVLGDDKRYTMESVARVQGREL